MMLRQEKERKIGAVNPSLHVRSNVSLATAPHDGGERQFTTLHRGTNGVAAIWQQHTMFSAAKLENILESVICFCTTIVC